MMRYQICDLELESNIHFPELLWAARGKGRMKFRLLPPREPMSSGFNWIQHRYASESREEPWLSIGRSSFEYLLRFPGLADFCLSMSGKTVSCHPAGGVAQETLRHLFLDQVVPMVLQHQHRLVLHAGAVVLPRGAVAFLGASGFGKSTLTASFASRGFPLLTDDCLVLEDWDGSICGVPSYPCLRLWPQNHQKLLTHRTNEDGPVYKFKKRVVLTNGVLPFCTSIVPLRKVYLLSDPMTAGQAISIKPVSASEVFLELVRNSFHLDSLDRQRVVEEVETLSRLSVLPLFSRLDYPRELNQLEELQTRILTDLEEV